MGFPGGRHWRAHRPSVRRSAWHAPSQSPTGDHAQEQWTAECGCHRGECVQEALWSQSARGVCAVGRADGHGRRSRMEGDGTLDQIRGGCGRDQRAMGQTARGSVVVPFVAEPAALLGNGRRADGLGGARSAGRGVSRGGSGNNDISIDTILS